LNLAKFRKAQAEAEEAEERASLNEHAMAKLRALGRAGSAQPFNWSTTNGGQDNICIGNSPDRFWLFLFPSTIWAISFQKYFLWNLTKVFWTIGANFQFSDFRIKSVFIHYRYFYINPPFQKCFVIRFQCFFSGIRSL